MVTDDDDFKIDYRIILRFVSSSHASLSRIMSMNKIVPDMDSYIKIYMDCMVEMDSDILKLIKTNSDYIHNITNDSSIIETDRNNITKSKHKNKGNGKQKFTNFVKSNSLGIFSVAKSHNEFGPLILNWEGGYSGESKIQEVKPLLGIKKINADWEKIAIKKYYQVQTINKIMESSQNLIDPKPKNSRETEGLLKNYSNINVAEAAVLQCEPLSAILDHDDCVYIGYRPIDKSSRSQL